MLTNSNYFVTGAQYPPKSAETRIREFDQNSTLYANTRAADVILYGNGRLATDEKRFNADGTTNLPKYKVNLFRAISRFWASMLFGFPPVIEPVGTAPIASPAHATVLQNLFNTASQVAIDASRFGTGVYMITDPGDGIKVEVVQPRHWFPIVDAANPARIVGDVIAVPYNDDSEGPLVMYGNRIQITRLIVGEAASVINYKLEGGKVGAPIGDALHGGSPLANRAIISVVNGYAENHFGESDYTDIIDVVSELGRRASGNSKVLDTHTNPHLTGPRGAVVSDDNTVPRVNVEGMYFPVEEGDPKVAYLTWNSELDANFRQMDKMLDIFFMLSNTSATALGLEIASGTAESGAALRKLLFSSYLRLGGMRRIHELAINTILGTLYPSNLFTVTWPDPYLDGAVETATAEEIRLRSGTTTPAQSIARLDFVASSEAEILAAKALNNPTLGVPNNGEQTRS